MASKKDKELQVGLKIDTSDLLRSSKEAIQILKSFTNVVNNTLSNLGKISVPDIMKSNAELVSGKGYGIRRKAKATPIESVKDIVDEEGNLKGSETKTISYAYYKKGRGKLLQKEEQITRKILDNETGLYKTTQRTIVSRQQQTYAGKVWQKISDSTVVNGEKEIKQAKELLKQQKARAQEDKKDGRTKNPIQKIFDRLKSVASYRMIRNFLKTLVASVTESFREIAKISSSFNKDISDVTSDITKMKGAVGATAASFMNVLKPAIAVVSALVVRLGNDFSALGAVITGNNKKIQVSTEFWKDYNAAVNGTLLSFDTFNTLSEKSDMSGLFKEEDVSVLDKILSIVMGIGASALFVWLTSGGLDKIKDRLKTIIEKFTGVKKVADGTADATKKVSDNMKKTVEDTTKTGNAFSKFYNSIQPLHIVVLGITEALSGWSQVFDDSVTGAKKVFAWITAIAGTVAIIAGILAAFLPTGAAKVMKAVGFGAAIAGGISSIVGSFMPNTYATGGQFSSGDFFVANENGSTEMIASTNSGGNVMNLEQWENVAYNSYLRALQTYNAAKDGKVNMNDIGRAVADSTGFINEINRKNASIRLV